MKATCKGCGQPLKLEEDGKGHFCWSCWPEKQNRHCTPYTQQQKERHEAEGYWTRRMGVERGIDDGA